MSTIKRHSDQSVAILTLNRPEKRNAISTELILDLEKEFELILTETHLNAVVLTGEAPAFCAGSDLNELGQLDDSGKKEHEAITAKVIRYLRKYPLPTLSAVEGFALGGGFALAIACDYVISADNARWQMPEVKNGWIPPWGINPLLDRVSRMRAQQILWGETGSDNERLLSWGLLDRLCLEGRALEEAIQIAHSLASLPTDAVRSVKEFILMTPMSDKMADQHCLDAFQTNCATEEAQKIFNKFNKGKND